MYLNNKRTYCSTFEYILYTLTNTYYYDECLVSAFDEYYRASFEDSGKTVRLETRDHRYGVSLPLTVFKEYLHRIVEDKNNTTKLDHLEEHQYDLSAFWNLVKNERQM